MADERINVTHRDEERPSLIERMVHLSNLYGRYQEAVDNGGYVDEGKAARALVEALIDEVEHYGVIVRPTA
jgi:hypothetical protein